MGASGGRGPHSYAGESPPRSEQRPHFRMAAAACGLQSAGSAATKSHKERPRRAKDSGRRRAALLFLSNISLDGRPLGRGGTDGSVEQHDEKVGEQRVGDVAPTAGPPAAPSAAPPPAAAPGHPEPGGQVALSLHPGPRPSLVMSPGPAAGVAGANEVFLEAGEGGGGAAGGGGAGGGGEDTAPLLTPDTPLPPVPPPGQPPSRARSPSVFSPGQAASAAHLDSRQRYTGEDPRAFTDLYCSLLISTVIFFTDLYCSLLISTDLFFTDLYCSLLISSLLISTVLY